MSNLISLTVKASALSRGKRLKSLRKMADLSRRYLAEKHQLSASTLQAWEEGKSNGLSPKGAQRVVQALSEEGVCCTIEWLLNGEGQTPYLSDEKLVGVQTEETLAQSYGEIASVASLQVKQELNTFLQLNADAISLIIQDDGMQPFYQVGDLVAGKRFYKKDLDTLIGRDCIIETAEGVTLFRHLRRGRKPDSFTLCCTNLETTLKDFVLEDVMVVTAARVLWHRRPR